MMTNNCPTCDKKVMELDSEGNLLVVFCNHDFKISFETLLKRALLSERGVARLRAFYANHPELTLETEIQPEKDSEALFVFDSGKTVYNHFREQGSSEAK